MVNGDTLIFWTAVEKCHGTLTAAKKGFYLNFSLSFKQNLLSWKQILFQKPQF